jgi:hypothetical protein
MTFGPIFHQSLRGFLRDQPKISELLGGFNDFLFSPTRMGMMIQSDELIFIKMVKTTKQS